MGKKFTHAELLGALHDAAAAPEEDQEWYTVNELAELAGCCPQTMRKRLHELDAQGRLECGKKWITTLDKHQKRVSAYRIKGLGHE